MGNPILNKCRKISCGSFKPGRYMRLSTEAKRELKNYPNKTMSSLFMQIIILQGITIK
jgi:hypothetical protein